jgi:hypothetical protein
LGPVFSFGSESEIRRLQKATAEVRIAATDDSTAVATAAKSTAMEMVISTQYHVCGAWARRPARVR